MRPNPQVPADLVTFTEEILNGKLHFLCSIYKITLTHSSEANFLFVPDQRQLYILWDNANYLLVIVFNESS